MRVAASASKRRSDLFAAASAMLGAMAYSVAAGAVAGFVVTVVWFRNTRSDGAIAFVISAIAAGLFVSVVAYVAMVCRHHIPSPYTTGIPALLWLLAAMQLTWMKCKDSFITADHVLWIWRSGDERMFELGWLMRAWIAILVSLLAAVVAGGWLLKSRRAQSTRSHCG